MLHINEEIKDILELGQALAKEKFYYHLFDLILDGCMKFTQAEGGEFYALDNGSFRAVISKNKVLEARGINVDDSEETIAMNPHNIVAHTVAHRKVIRVDDIYNEKNFEILKLKEKDIKNDYRTKSMMLVPIIDADKKIDGVIQLFNCTNDEGEIIPFPEEYEILVSSLTSQMATTMSNMILIQDLEDLLGSFVECMTTAIDARTPYNANHTINVAQLCMDFSDYINGLYTKGEYSGFINDNEVEQLYMAASLHDLGKMITPREVLNKSTRLGLLYDNLVNKLEKIQLSLKIDMLEGRLDDMDWAVEDMHLSNFIAELPRINISDFLTEDDVYRISEMSKKIYVNPQGVKIAYLDEAEKVALNIVKGTLTDEERKIVQQHVEYTEKMLDKIRFNAKYNRVRSIASNHHEYLDGSGYPKGIKADKIDNLTRILTICDIYDSLTSNDRPYKGTIPVEKALAILDSMVSEGKLDKNLVRIFRLFVLEKTDKAKIAK